MTLAFISSDESSLSQLSLMPVGSYLPFPSKKGMRLPDHLFFSDHVQIMLVRSRSTASTASCLRRDRRSDRSSLFADKSHSTLTCTTGSVASSSLQGRTAVVVGYRSPPLLSYVGTCVGPVGYRSPPPLLPSVGGPAQLRQLAPALSLDHLPQLMVLLL